jgi:hypothetical protein
MFGRRRSEAGAAARRQNTRRAANAPAVEPLEQRLLLSVTVPFSEPWEGPTYMHMRNKAMGTVYTGQFVDGAPVPTGVFLQPDGGVGGDGDTYPALETVDPTGALQGEDGWGIFQVDAIFKGKLVGTNNIIDTDVTNPLYHISDASHDVEIIGIYHGRSDDWVRFNDDDYSGAWDFGDDSTDVEFSADRVAVYAQQKHTFRDVTRTFLGDPLAEPGAAGSSARLGAAAYRGIGYDAAGNPLPEAVATLALTLASEPGYWGRFHTTEGLADFTPEGTSGTGDIDVYYSVTGGDDQARWDSDGFLPTKTAGGPYANADFRIHTTDSAVQQSGAYDWLVTSSDPMTSFVNIPRPDIDIEKATNGADADDPTGPYVPVGDPVTWTYELTNPGNVALANVTVTDDNGTPGDLGDDFSPAFVGGDDGDGLLEPGELWVYEADGTAEAGQYANLASVTGDDPDGGQVSDTDPSHYFGFCAKVHIEKATNGADADCWKKAPKIPVGEDVTWRYVLTNRGNVALANVTVTDDNGTPGDPGDDFTPAYVGGDADGDGLLDIDETWVFVASGTATCGLYGNVGEVTAEGPGGRPVSDTDPSHYRGVCVKYEGCTPGFWKQCHHLRYWTGYSPHQKFDGVFGVDAPCNKTLLQTLWTGGGGRRALGRHAVAALLNAASDDVNYKFTEAQVIGIVQWAYRTGNFEAAKDVLAEQNELGCDLGGGCGGGWHGRCDWLWWKKGRRGPRWGGHHRSWWHGDDNGDDGCGWSWLKRRRHGGFSRFGRRR